MTYRISRYIILEAVKNEIITPFKTRAKFSFAE
jgi:hypothetical protein